ncbi:MAG: hypothetical protein KJ065_23045 [Anaerolineae bacterium]|nr:hypothetical protein [Anaerolineae bacterium]
MAISMHNCVVQLDDSGGSPVNISGQANAIKISYKKEIGRFHTLASVWNDATEGGIDTDITLTVLETENVGQAHALCRDWIAGGGARTLRIDTPASVSGALRYEGEVRIAALDPALDRKAGSGDPALTTVQLVGIGSWSPSVIP